MTHHRVLDRYGRGRMLFNCAAVGAVDEPVHQKVRNCKRETARETAEDVERMLRVAMTVARVRFGSARIRHARVTSVRLTSTSAVTING